MVDEEGELASVDVNAVFVNGKPSKIECKYVSIHVPALRSVSVIDVISSLAAD